jgi:hypothetical protein
MSLRIHSLQKKRKNCRWFIQNEVFFFVDDDMDRFEAIGFHNFHEGVLKAVAEAE